MANQSRTADAATTTGQIADSGLLEHPLSWEQNRWPHRIALLLALTVFPLIWLGATVTTYAAGMAVPDWPGTFGYNMFLYPWTTWMFGPFNLMVEHGHRLLASLAGMINIGLVVATWHYRCDRRIQWFALALLGVILVQGGLGGARVVLDARTLARAHGMLGPAFFTMVVGFCVVTSRWWTTLSVANGQVSTGDQTGFLMSAAQLKRLRSIGWFAGLMLIACYLQLCLGSFLRHVVIDTKPAFFTHLLYTHLALASVILLATGVHWWRSVGKGLSSGRIAALSHLLLVLVLLQFSLGLSTWIVKYGWSLGPFSALGSTLGIAQWEFAAKFVIIQRSLSQANTITAHVAVGSLILAVWAIQWLSVYRLKKIADFSTLATLPR